MADKNISVSLKANIKDVQSKLDEVAKSLDKLEQEAEQAGKGLGKASDEANAFKKGLSSLKDSLAGSIMAANLATQAFGYMAGTISNAIQATIALGMQTEQLQAKFGAMKNNLMQASEAYQIFNDVGRDTNYDMAAINDMGVKLINLGYNAQQAAEMIRIVSDTAAGLGKGQEGAVALMDSLNRMNSTGQFTIREFKALQEEGLKVEQALAKAFGTDTQSVLEMVKDGAIDGKDAFEILANYMQTDFAGSMAASKQNTIDLWGDLAGNIQTICGEIGASIFEAFNQSEIVQELIGITQNLIDLIRSDTQGVFHDLKIVAGGVLDFIGGAFHAIVQAIKLVIIVGNEMYEAFKSLGASIAKALSPILKPLGEIFSIVAKIMKALGKEVSNGIDASWSDMIGGAYDPTDTYGATDAVNYKGNGNYKAVNSNSSSGAGGNSKQLNAYDQLKAKAQQTIDSIKSAWQQMFLTKEELIDVWYQKQLDALDKNVLDEAEHKEALMLLNEMYDQKRTELLAKQEADEAKAREKRLQEEKKAHEAVNRYWEGMAMSASSAFSDCIMNGKSFGDAFKQIIKGIIQQLIQALMYAMLLSAFGGGGASFGKNFGKAFFGGSKDGGLIMAASGGFISGAGTSRSDSIPTMLSNGEYVVNASSTKQYLPLLENINNSGKSSANGGAISAGNNITLNVSAMDASGFSDFLARGGLDSIKEAMFNDDLNFAGVGGAY